MEMLLGTYGVKLLELARHYPSVAFCIALAVFAAIDWLINPEGSPGDAGVGGFFDAGDGTAAISAKAAREALGIKRPSLLGRRPKFLWENIPRTVNENHPSWMIYYTHIPGQRTSQASLVSPGIVKSGAWVAPANVPCCET
jgi:hypothetical protein